MPKPEKPVVSIRKPPVDPTLAERFVAEGTSAPPAAPRSSGSLTDRRDGRTLRRTTVYLPPELIPRLRIYAAHQEQDVSVAIASICAEFLDGWEAKRQA